MEDTRQAHVTRLLAALETGSGNTDDLLAVVYDELRSLARQRMQREPAGQTLQPTALVHEAWLRLCRDDARWHGRGHFFGAAARAMRRILVERARRRRRIKHGGGLDRVEGDDLDAIALPENVDVLALDEALAKLERQDPRMAEVVMLRWHAGLGVEETAAALAVSARTVKREWAVARAWLYRELGGAAAEPDAPR